MKVRTSHSHGTMLFELEAESDSDRAVLGISAAWLSAGSHVAQYSGHTYSCDLAGYTGLGFRVSPKPQPEKES